MDNILESFDKIESKDSVLFKNLNYSENQIKEHLENYLNNDFDTIAIFKFKEHLPDLKTVWQNIRLLDMCQEELANDKPDLPFKVIQIHEQDWFFEFCAALGGLGGLAAVIQLIYSSKKDRSFHKTINEPYTTTQQVGNQLKRQTSYRRTKKVITTIGKEQWSTELISEYLNEELESIELYTKNGEIYRGLDDNERNKDNKASS